VPEVQAADNRGKPLQEGQPADEGDLFTKGNDQLFACASAGGLALRGGYEEGGIEIVCFGLVVVMSSPLRMSHSVMLRSKALMVRQFSSLISGTADFSGSDTRSGSWVRAASFRARNRGGGGVAEAVAFSGWAFQDDVVWGMLVENQRDAQRVWRRKRRGSSESGRR